MRERWERIAGQHLIALTHLKLSYCFIFHARRAVVIMCRLLLCACHLFGGNSAPIRPWLGTWVSPQNHSITSTSWSPFEALEALVQAEDEVVFVHPPVSSTVLESLIHPRLPRPLPPFDRSALISPGR